MNLYSKVKGIKNNDFFFKYKKKLRIFFMKLRKSVISSHLINNNFSYVRTIRISLS